MQKPYSLYRIIPRFKRQAESDDENDAPDNETEYQILDDEDNKVNIETTTVNTNSEDNQNDDARQRTRVRIRNNDNRNNNSEENNDDEDDDEDEEERVTQRPRRYIPLILMLKTLFVYWLPMFSFIVLKRCSHFMKK